MTVALFRQFPLQRADDNHAHFYTVFWTHHVIVHAVANDVRYEEHPTPLSVKCVFRGRELYRIERRTVAVEDDTYLIVNHGRTYASWIDDGEPTESLAVFFQRGFIATVHHALRERTERLLEEPHGERELVFFEHLHRHDREVSPALHRLRAVRKPTQAWLDEQLHAIAAGLVRVHAGARRETERLSALRASTRLELYQRLHRGRDFLDSNYAADVTLAAAAAAAALAPHHFLRTFREAFGVTPLRYVMLRRLARARQLVETTRRPIADIAATVGMADASTLTRAFRRHYGVPPSELREKQSRHSAVSVGPVGSGGCDSSSSC